MWHVLGRTEIPTGFWWRSLKGRYRYEALDVEVRIVLKCTLKK